MTLQPIQTIHPGQFEPDQHFYPKVLNAQLHPLVHHFLSMDPEQWVYRYCHLHPQVDPTVLGELLSYTPLALHWSGADLFYATTDQGQRSMIVIETNSCPSGQKSMPLLNEGSEQGGYGKILQECFKPLIQKKRLPKGGLAVLYDKNLMENSGYAATMADVFQEPVYLCRFQKEDLEQSVRFRNGVLEVRQLDSSEPGSQWMPIRAAFRYVTQQPWNRIPLETRTLIFNPVLACLAGGRNKLVASKAYTLLNKELAGSGLSIQAPETLLDVSLAEIPRRIQQLGGRAVIKIPYSNAGLGVFTITSPQELEEFMAMDHHYDQFIVQSLIGNKGWSSTSLQSQYYHIGTVPDRKNKSYVADLRFMIGSTPSGYRPVVVYARRAKSPLTDTISQQQSWDILGTNLSKKLGDNQWDTETKRLILMDRKEFNQLGIGIDDLIEGYIQTVLSTIAIDKLARQLTTSKGTFRKSLFQSLDHDPTLWAELYPFAAEQDGSQPSSNNPQEAVPTT